MESFSEVAFNRSYESLQGIDTDSLMSLISIKTLQAITLEGVRECLKTGAKLNIKFGTDPTGPDLHLGHIVPIRVLDIFRRAGHNIDLIFGDFTAKIGDPTERTGERRPLTDDQIKQNMATFREQVDKYCDTHSGNVKIHQNSTWLGNMTLPEIFQYLQAINLTEAVQRNDFRERIRKGRTVNLAEMIYGTLMGIDSVQLATDIEIGGIDQLLNFQQARKVQSMKGGNVENVLMTPIIEGTSGDGKKMSKSCSNYIAVKSDPDEVFGKILSIPDTLIIPYLKAFAPVYESEIADLEKRVAVDPLEMKKQLAMYMSAVSASNYPAGMAAREKFEKTFSLKQIDSGNAKDLIINKGQLLLDAIFSSGDFKSRGELRRLTEQGAIKVEGRGVLLGELLETEVSTEIIVKIGKRKFYRIIPI